MVVGDAIRATVDRFEEGATVLLFDDESFGHHSGQSLTVPKRLLPKGVKQGDVVVLEVMTSDEATATREQAARKLLEDILNGK